MTTKSFGPSQTLSSSTENLRRDLYGQVETRLAQQSDVCQTHSREFECFCEGCRV